MVLIRNSCGHEKALLKRIIILYGNEDWYIKMIEKGNPDDKADIDHKNSE